jgi:hypothetical protein
MQMNADFMNFSDVKDVNFSVGSSSSSFSRPFEKNLTPTSSGRETPDDDLGPAGEREWGVRFAGFLYRSKDLLTKTPTMKYCMH